MKVLYPDLSRAQDFKDNGDVWRFGKLLDIFKNSQWTRMTSAECTVSGLLRFEDPTSQNSDNRTSKLAAKPLWKSCLSPQAVTMTN